MGRQTFFLGTRCLGSRNITDFRLIPGLEVRALHSRAYFCGKCGDIWGRLLHDKAGFTECTLRPCLAHGDGRFSQYHDFGEGTDFSADWPAAAKLHETRAWLEYAWKFSTKPESPLAAYLADPTSKGIHAPKLPQSAAS